MNPKILIDNKMKLISSEINKTTLHVIINDADTLEFNNSTEFKDRFKKDLPEKLYHWLVIDLKNIRYIDSSGLGALVTFLKQVKEQQSDVIIINANNQIEKLMKMTRLDQLFIMHRDLEDAEKSYSGTPRRRYNL